MLETPVGSLSQFSIVGVVMHRSAAKDRSPRRSAGLKPRRPGQKFEPWSLPIYTAAYRRGLFREGFRLNLSRLVPSLPSPYRAAR